MPRVRSPRAAAGVVIERDRELLARLACVNGNMGAATLRLMRDLDDGLLPAGLLRELGAHLGDLAADLTARADELDRHVVIEAHPWSPGRRREEPRPPGADQVPRHPASKQSSRTPVRVPMVKKPAQEVSSGQGQERPLGGGRQVTTVAIDGAGVRALVDELHAAGNIPAVCRSAFESVDRGWFVPDQIWAKTGSDEDEPISRTDDPRRWRAAVCSDNPVVTQYDDGETPWPHVGERPTCSASQPSIVAGMLGVLDVQPGDHVLEIGAGTGYNAALLSQLVGPTGTVITVEVDHVLAAEARTRLRELGYTANVQVLCGDGAEAIASAQPWDRVIATAGVHLGRLPYQWVADTRPGGVIVAPMRADLVSRPLVRFVVGADGTATGHAIELRVGFMEMRAQRVATWPVGEDRWDDENADISYTDLAPWAPLQVDDQVWPIAVAVPSCRMSLWERTEDRPHGVAWLRDPVSRSWASVVPSGEKGRYLVRQSGPRRLWDEAETAYRWWQRRGEPPLEAWLWEVGPDRQSVTLPDR